MPRSKPRENPTSARSGAALPASSGAVLPASSAASCGVTLALAISPGGAFHLVGATLRANPTDTATATDAASDVPTDTAVATATDAALATAADTALDAATALSPDTAAHLRDAFAKGAAHGLLHLATADLTTDLPPSLAFGREIGRRFLAALCHTPDLEAQRASLDVPPADEDIADLLQCAPPMVGAEYLTDSVLAMAWAAILSVIAAELRAFPGPVQDYLQSRNPAWNVMGRVCFHLAENKADEEAPFAFLATYARGVSATGRVQHAPLGNAIAELAGPGKKADLLRLLSPVQRAAQRSSFVRELVDSGELFHPLAWTPREAHAFLKDTAALEQSGVVVRVPDWWQSRRPPRPQVKVTVGAKVPSQVGTDAMLDFSVRLVLDGETLSPDEWRQLLEGTESLRFIKGRWVEVDREKLREVLDHWKKVERGAAGEGVSFLEGMRLLAGMPPGESGAAEEMAPTAEWTAVTAGPWLSEVLAGLRRPQGNGEADPGDDLKGTLRSYQRDGVAWLWLLSRLGLGACLADDMGLGKTIQVLALLLLLKKKGHRGPHLLVVPASLLGNWRAEMQRFAPSLVPFFAHPSFGPVTPEPGELASIDLVVTTYGTLLRAPWIAEVSWGLVVLDEAQAIKNPGARQTRAVKALKSHTRLALTGTPVENRLGDLWSLFDFLCPGLLGTVAAFRRFTKQSADAPKRGYAPLRNLVRPYILRRMKSDRQIAPDLPDKTEVNVFCPLTKVQAAMYTQAVAELSRALDSSEGIQRRGLILAYLMRFKQLCNHPSQWTGDGAYAPADSGKMARLGELCEPIVARQEKVLVFTQFREMTAPLAAFLTGVFGRPGLVLHGETLVKKRAELVSDFQREDGPPFFVLSLKAGGTGLNLTAASHVIHFDRWWNPAVENQATDRAYRIGQKKNVLVHKFVCRGTIEEKIDALIASKRELQSEILAGSGEAWLTEMKSDELLRLVSLDIHSALQGE